MSRALILQHGDWGPPALLGDWAQERGIPFDVYRVDHGGPWPEVDDQLFVASLGSKYSPADDHVRDVVRGARVHLRRRSRPTSRCSDSVTEPRFSRSCSAASVEPAPEPELGWHTVRVRCPRGRRPAVRGCNGTTTASPCRPARVSWLARRGRCRRSAPAATSAVQFHPESTIEIVQGWARIDGERLLALGIDGRRSARRRRRAPGRRRARGRLCPV